MYTYKLMLRFAFPSPSAPTSFKDLEKDLNEASERFNLKFIGKKKIQIGDLNGVAYVNLITEQPVANPTREISAFSQILKNDFNWRTYSQADNRMFDATLLESPSDVGTINVINDDSSSKSTIQQILQIDDIEELDKQISNLKFLLKIAEAKKVILEAESLSY